ncbi:MAG: hypothetical protein RL441_145 [Actinomycetota bacterium]|jgi:hypothetical protein
MRILRRLAEPIERWDARFDEKYGSQIEFVQSWVGIPALAVVVLLVGLLDAGPTYRALWDQGTHGTVTITRTEKISHWRGGQTLDFYGNFKSNDGDVFRPDIRFMYDGVRLDVGDVVQAIDTGHDSGVYPIGGNRAWISDTLWVAGALVALGYKANRLRLNIRRRRHSY